MKVNPASSAEVKATRISAEERRLKIIYSKTDRKNKSIIQGLIRRAAYMRVTLEDYEADLDAGGYVEKFTQSPTTEPYDRERPVARLYNAMNKNYQSIMKQLADILPEPEHAPKDDGFNEFLARRGRK